MENFSQHLVDNLKTVAESMTDQISTLKDTLKHFDQEMIDHAKKDMTKEEAEKFAKFVNGNELNDLFQKIKDLKR